MKYCLTLALIFVLNHLFSQQQILDKLVDKWHQDASDANFTSYFEVMTENFVFLGTDPEERWNKTQFATFCKPYFDQGKAWSFTAKNRNWVYSHDKKIAWFDEDLDTWMEGCRGSGILIKERGKWKLAYYNLTVLIENDKIEEFIELRKK